MSVRFPAVTSLEVIEVLEKIGFRFKRQAGSSHPLSLCICLSDVIGFQHP